ncbi:MAG: ATP-binding protein [Geobacteraceae bacterium]|nr:ATP-binding protein [Geobacteraceae bacterium]
MSVKVGDTGGGIPLEALGNVFNSFFTTKEAGTGLGLPIANRIVTNHGGKIQLANKIGMGAEFNVILPLSP